MSLSADPEESAAHTTRLPNPIRGASLFNSDYTLNGGLKKTIRYLTPKWQPLFAFTSRKHLVPLLLAISCAVASGALPTVQAIILGSIFDAFTDFGTGNLSNDAFRGNIGKSCSYLAGLAAATWLLTGGFFAAWLVFGELQAHNCRHLVFERLLRRPCGWFDMRSSGGGTLVARLHIQIRDLQIATSQPLGTIFQRAVTALASLTVAFLYCWSLTLVILATVPVLAICLAWISAHMQSSIEKQQSELGKASKTAATALAAIETVKSFNGQAQEAQKYKKAIAKAAKWYNIQARGNALQIGLVKAMTLCMFVQGFWYGHYLVLSGSRSTGDVVTTFWSALAATQALEQILPQLLVLEKGRFAGALLRAIINLAGIPSREDQSEQKRVVPSAILGEIELRDVSFSYPARRQRLALDHMSCKIPAGCITFITGESGCGKSTLSQLLLRFYDTTSGEIYLDGFPIKDLDRFWLRRNIMLVEQDSILFNGSLRYNIGLGRPDTASTSPEDFRNATQFALLDEMVNDLPHGLETKVGTYGNSLSGGQRQRVALARARLRDSPVLILDESTSALDQPSKSLIMTAIRSWRRGKTTIIITHDESQIQEEDIKLTITHGKVLGSGSHDASRDDIDGKHLGVVGNSLGKERLQSATPLPPLSTAFKLTGGLDPIAGVEPLEFAVGNVPRARYIPTIFTDKTSPMATAFWNSSMIHSSGLKAGTTYDIHTSVKRSYSSSCNESNDQGAPESTLQLLQLSGNAALQNRVCLVAKHGRNGSWDRTQDEQVKVPDSVANLTVRSILATAWPVLDAKCRIFLILGALSSVLHAIATPMFAWVFSRLLSTFNQSLDSTSTAAQQSSLAIIGIAVIDGCACFFMHALLEYCGQRWVDCIRLQAILRLLDQPQQFFTGASVSLSHLIADLDRSAEEMRNLLGRFAAFVLVGVIMMFVALLWSLITCWKLTLVGLTLAPTSYAVTRAFRIVSAKMEAQCNDAANTVANVAHEVFSNIKTVRALTLEQSLGSRHSTSVSYALGDGFRRAVYCGIFVGMSEASVGFMIALIFWYGAVLVASGELSVNDVLLVFSMLLFSLANITAIIAFVPQIQSSKDTAMRLMSLANLPKTSHEHVGSTRLTATGDISFNKLDFSYSDSQENTVLRGLELTLASGRLTAVVGPSGSGKSTILGLILRIHQTPTTRFGKAPTLMIAGRDINSIETSSLRDLVVVVPQKGYLFPLSISENIKYGLPEASPKCNHESVRAAARDAGLDEFVMSLPMGYDTVVGDGGCGLSGGQVQRLALARALIRDPEVLLLDEATSALDACSAAHIRATLQRLRRQRPSMTMIIITHEREMMEIADSIVMMKNGRVVEQGKYHELMEYGGHFAKMLAGG